ncbi:DUF3784 domain-containing protein [Enterococcus caccae]|uniref:DUF3784 domain-containing protein n=1 Tax=Enterococcus caccae ATCC BAA-1240 TaxID=1158612 RepID=R3TYU4_9ENTE|nr:DUF3784 domain-containing protein [Enterococcus caccae]EOL46343.1 hypothetical protein UC7_01310 [Enterococcus caccae ATCC BAA-1240]EOT60712.1 hypothetical protein I580_01612 [Enterococcus caccae ATCC BAA-1240]
MLELIMILMFILCGIQLWRGKWLWLIAGYNTATKQEKAKLNGKMLGKAVSGLLFISAISIGLTSFFPEIKLVTIVGIIVLVGMMIAYVNTSPKFRQK